jgi:hypothetical protein
MGGVSSCHGPGAQTCMRRQQTRSTRRLGVQLSRRGHHELKKDETTTSSARAGHTSISRPRSVSRTGMSETDARYAARRAFGNVTHTQEDMRAVWTRRWLDELVQTCATPSARPARAPVTHPRIITRSRCPGDLSDAQVRADASSYTYSTCERTAPSSPAILGFVESIT